jgi:Uma2 family endonuclease
MKRMGVPVKKEDRIYTYADYLAWPDEERWELIDGVAYDMSPAPGRKHQGIVGIVFNEIFQYLKDQPCEVYVAPFDVRLAEEPGAPEEKIINVVQPDASVYCREADQLDEAGALAPPDIAVEVLSPCTSVKDQREKLALYERFGVKEYWIIDPANETLSVYTLAAARKSAGLPRGNTDRPPEGAGLPLGGYGKPEVYGREDTFASRILEGFTLDVGELFA